MFRSRRSLYKGSPNSSLFLSLSLALFHGVFFSFCTSLSRLVLHIALWRELQCSRKTAREIYTLWPSTQGSTTAALTSHETIEFRNGPFPRRRFSSSPLPSYPAACPKREVTRLVLYFTHASISSGFSFSAWHTIVSYTRDRDTRYFSRRAFAATNNAEDYLIPVQRFAVSLSLEREMTVLNRNRRWLSRKLTSWHAETCPSAPFERSRIAEDSF